MTTTRRPRGTRGQWIVISVLSLAVGFLIYQQVLTNLTLNDTVETARTLAEPVDDLCRDDPTARRKIGTERCDQAAEVQRDPSAAATPPPSDGRDGRPGRGIASTAIVDGHLIVIYDDGAREDEGVVVGATGVAGPDGRGITSATVDATGQFVLTFTDGIIDVVGHVVGADGATGRGIARTEAVDGRLLVYYDDAPSVAVDVGPLPSGPVGPAGTDGAPGRGIATLDLDLNSCTVTIYYTDDTSETKHATGCDNSPPVTTTSDPPLLPTP